MSLLIGPCGNPRTDMKVDQQYKEFMFQLDLRAFVSTFFCDNNGHDPWINPANDEKFHLDQFLVPCIHLRLVKGKKKKHYGAPNDHSAPFSYIGYHKR